MMSEDEAKIEWLRTAAQEGFGAIERGEGQQFESVDDLDAYILEISEEVFCET